MRLSKWTLPRTTKTSPIIYIFVFLLANWVGPAWGQDLAKKLLQPNDFIQWTTMGEPNISSDGEWTTIQLYSQQAVDTLKVFSTSSPREYTFSDSYNATFNRKGNWLAFSHNQRGVGLLELATSSLKYIAGDTFKFSEDGNVLAVKIANDSREKKPGVLVYKLEQKDSLFLVNGIDFSFNSKSNKLLYTVKKKEYNAVSVLDLNNLKHTEISKSANNYKHLLWSGVEDAFFFVENDSILHFRKVDKSHSSRKIAMDGQFLNGMRLGFLPPFFSHDGQRVFFYLQKNLDRKSTSDTLPSVQIWKGTDKWIYPQRQYEGTPEEWPLLSFWEPNSGRVEQIGSSLRPQVILSPDSRHSLCYNILQYEPHYQQFPIVDIYLRDLNTGEENLLITKQQTGVGYVQLSPSGKHIAYFDGRDWINYNIAKQTHTNLTADLNSSFYNSENDRPEPPAPYGNGGWTNNDKEFLVYDTYDVWMLSLNANKKKRLTEGRENKTVYKIPTNMLEPFPLSRYPEYQGHEVDMSQEVILFVELPNKAMGFKVLNPNGNITDFAISTSSVTSRLQMAKDKREFVFTEENPKTPPQVRFKKGFYKSSSLIYQNNSQYKNYKLGKRELITYNSGEWKDVKAVLYYPDDYVLGQKYPMITQIYELQSSKMFKFSEPSQYSGDGYNVRNFIADGYFVLEPDLEYRIGDPGPSVVECVEAAVNKVLEINMVDKDRLGLIGHSFGGYETAFIIAHTDIFAAAVAGAGIYDITNYYFSIRWDIGRPDMWRYENQQQRMGKSFFEDIEGYQRNSPIIHAKNINTPLLLWAGSYDRNVHWFQSVEMYLALRRLNKNVEFYLYPGEEHNLRTAENQLDLNLKIKDWFDEYLK